MRKLWIILISSASLGILIVLVFILAVWQGAYGHLQTREELLNYKNATASIVLSDTGELLGKFFSENRTNVAYEEIPQHLLDALIATEDIRFFRHNGYDTKSFFRVLIKTIILRNRNAGGGSTITQQLAKNMYGRENYGRLTIYVNKVKEIILARRIEKAFSKEEIILLYLNTVSFGENVYGVEAAARRFFNKDVADLEIEEGAVLIGILKANSFYNPRIYPENAKRRRNVVLGQMKKYGFLEPVMADSLASLPLESNYVNYEAGGPADYFLYQIRSEVRAILEEVSGKTGKDWNMEEEGLVITTTLSLPLQNYANQAFNEHLGTMQERLNKQYNTQSGRRTLAAIADRELKRLGMSGRAGEPSFQVNADSSVSGPVTVRDSMISAVKILQAGLMAMNPVTGEIKAYVGGIDFRTQPYDQILARRQVASTFKPILFAAALEEGWRPCDYLDNDSIENSGIDGWSPRNFDHSYGGKYSFAGALKHSMNVPTYNLYMNTSFGRIDTLWDEMGFSYNLRDYPSVPMGTAEASVREVAIAYSTFANGGYRVQPHTVVSIKTHDGELLWQNDFAQEKKKILSERSVLLISAILRRAVTGGTGTPLVGAYGVSLPFAGKTGTSQDYADAWFAAFNPGLVVVSRVGASTPAVHFTSGSNGSGSTLALPLVARTLRSLEQNIELRKELTADFRFPAEIEDELGCPDYKEITFFDEVIDFFRGRKPIQREIIQPELKPGRRDDSIATPAPERRSIFRRWFGGKKR